ncbi:MAG: leucine-rich repeat domain-containing protein [Erysipelotrichaceae bacterium]|jgi:hypothetical protein|nr:leucine-rich repeat domain-containing protein [Erysipelotrichaceae bacterium]
MAEKDKYTMMEILNEEQQKEFLKRKKAKKRNYIVGLSVTGALALGLIAVYVLAANVWLIDYQNMSYITFSYPAEVEDGQEATATIVSINTNSNYPAEFRIPATINGYRITSIGDNAFAGCSRLTKVIMTDNITSIGSYAFAGCEKLADIQFSSNIEVLGTNALQNTYFFDHLPSDKVSAIHGILFHIGNNVVKENTVLLENHESLIPDEYKSGYNIVYMDDWVTKGDSAIRVWSDGLFANMDGLVYCELPSFSSFKSVPIDTFRNCTNLEGVTFPESIIKVESNAFRGCTNLEDITISSHIEDIGSYAFADSGLINPVLPETLLKISEGAFSGAKNITAIEWPDSLESISPSLFAECENLTSFDMSEHSYENINAIGSSAFKNTGLTTFDIPKKVNLISESVFSNSRNLTTVRTYEGKKTYDKHGNEIIEGVVKINRGAFNGCTSLDSLVLVDDERNNITPLHEINLPTTCISLSGDLSIFDSANTKKVNIPYSVPSIGYMMFSNNTSLEEVNIETKRVGAETLGINKIEYRAFYNCSNLKSFIVPETVSTIEQGAFENCESIETLTLPQSADSEYKVVRSEVFKNLNKLKHIDLSPNVNKVESNAFYGNYSLDYVLIKLDSAKNLGLNKGAFSKCREEGSTDKMPIFLSVLEKDVSPSKVIDGWYDENTAEVFWLDEWSYVDGVPTPNTAPVA